MKTTNYSKAGKVNQANSLSTFQNVSKISLVIPGVEKTKFHSYRRTRRENSVEIESSQGHVDDIRQNSPLRGQAAVASAGKINPHVRSTRSNGSFTSYPLASESYDAGGSGRIFPE